MLEGRQRIGRIRFVIERMPGVWLWNVSVHLTGGLPMGSSKDLDTAKAEFKEAWEALKGRILWFALNSGVHPVQRESQMAWKAPKIVEVSVGMEINMYMCAAGR